MCVHVHLDVQIFMFVIKKNEISPCRIYKIHLLCLLTNSYLLSQHANYKHDIHQSAVTGAECALVCLR